MNDYDDLFKDNTIQSEPPTKKPDNNTDPKIIPEDGGRSNRLIIIVYIAVLLLVSLFSDIYARLTYPDHLELEANIELISAPSISVSEIDDPDYDYQVVFTGTLKNNNQISLPRIWVQYELLDAEGNNIYTYYVDRDNISQNGIASFSESVKLGSEPITYTVTYGFDFSAMFYIVLNFAQVMVASVLAIFVDKLNFRRDWKRVKNEGFTWFAGQIVVGFGLVYAAMIVSQMLLVYVFGIESTSQNEIMIASMFSDDPLSLFLLFLSLCIFAPLIEELVFRKVLYGYLERKLGYAVAIIGSGLIFGLMHVISYGDFIQAIPYVLMGSVFGYIYHRSNRSIYVTIGVHFINNLISYILYFIAVIQFM
ncbi:MAG: CPBP family intramembrane metalloprotease [Bacilli bacterium]|nr:CPBP family intramembrane metalloprotease [Bacilli bacterium]